LANTNKRDPQKRPTKETYITETLQIVLADTADVMSILFGKYKQKRPTKETYITETHAVDVMSIFVGKYTYIHIHHKRDPQKRPTKETYKRDLSNRDPQNSCGRVDVMSVFFWQVYIHICTRVHMYTYV